jgi:hypothetical protein
MSRKSSKKTRFLREHPYCCFCGGTRAATTLDHALPKACFPRDIWPEEFEFPSCNLRNNGTSKHDTIFGYYSMRISAFQTMSLAAVGHKFTCTLLAHNEPVLP